MQHSRSVSFLILGVALCGAPAAAQDDPRPNVLLILADDLGCHDLSCTGSQYYETPNIDRIASESVVFTNGYAGCAVCSPSRASIMTGKFTARHGITDWIGAQSGERWRQQGRHSKLLPADYLHNLPHSFVTLPEALREAGYATFIAGKWHLGGKGSMPEDHGFDTSIVGRINNGYFGPYGDSNPHPHDPQEELSSVLAEETVHFIKANNPAETGRPFFAYLSFYAVHGPIQTTEQKWSKYRDKAEQMGLAPQGFQMGRYLPERYVQDNPVYAGLVEAMDDGVGIVLGALDELGLAENTIVIFTSDNGGVFSGDAFATSNAPLRGGKGHQLEGGIREPYFIKAPGHATPGQTCDTPVSGTDFYPTILELAGLPLRPEEHQDGLSLVPLLDGESLPPRPLVWHYPHYGNQGGEPAAAMRLGDWKLIHCYEDGRDELYNLADDPVEKADVSTVESARTASMRKALFSYLDSVGAKYPSKDPQYDAAAEQQRLAQVRKKQLPSMERQRLRFLSKDFVGPDNWWGSGEDAEE